MRQTSAESLADAGLLRGQKGTLLGEGLLLGDGRIVIALVRGMAVVVGKTGLRGGRRSSGGQLGEIGVGDRAGRLGLGSCGLPSSLDLVEDARLRVVEQRAGGVGVLSSGRDVGASVGKVLARSAVSCEATHLVAGDDLLADEARQRTAEGAHDPAAVSCVCSVACALVTAQFLAIKESQGRRGRGGNARKAAGTWDTCG